MFANSTLRATIAAIIVFTLAGCTSMQPLSSTRPTVVNSTIAVGDEVEILSVSGDRIEMEVEEKLPAGVRGDGQFVAFSDMASIKVRRVDGERTARAFHTGTMVLLIGAVLYALPGYSGGAALGNAN